MIHDRWPCALPQSSSLRPCSCPNVFSHTSHGVHSVCVVSALPRTTTPTGTPGHARRAFFVRLREARRRVPVDRRHDQCEVRVIAGQIPNPQSPITGPHRLSPGTHLNNAFSDFELRPELAQTVADLGY